MSDVFKTNLGKLIHGDCLDVMARGGAGVIDMVLCDLPYGTTACKWDTIIPFESLWREYRRVCKPNIAIALFGQEPFSSLLRCSNLDWFKYDWYWRKTRPSGFTNAKLKPLKDIEIISVFSEGMTANGSAKNMPYYPQVYMDGDRGVNPARKSHKLSRVIEKTGYPRQILDFANPNNQVLHPTQKPVDLVEYLIRTYTNEGDLVLDNCAGSGTTAIACENLNRRWICIEKDPTYFEVAKNRIETHVAAKRVEISA